MGGLTCYFTPWVPQTPDREAGLAGATSGLEKEDNLWKAEPKMARKLGQVAVQEMTHVSSGPSGLLWEQTLQQGDGGSQGSHRKAASGRFRPGLGTCETPGAAGAPHGLRGRLGPCSRPRARKPHWRATGPGCPVDSLPSAATTHTSCGLRQSPHTQATESNELTLGPSRFRKVLF